MKPIRWVKVTDRLPDVDKYKKVLIYVENSKQIFVCDPNYLNECFFEKPEDQPMICAFATHWAAID